MWHVTRISYTAKFDRKLAVLQIWYLMYSRRGKILCTAWHNVDMWCSLILHDQQNWWYSSYWKSVLKKKNAEDINFSMTSHVDCHKYETNTKLNIFFMLSFYTCKSLEIWRFGMYCRALQLWIKVNVSLSSDEVTGNWIQGVSFD